jgi:DNA-binding transcriptional ArsR family regulator
MNEKHIKELAILFKILSEPSRLYILHSLMDGPKTVLKIVDQVPTKQANVSKQLKILFEAGLVDKKRIGTSIEYRIKNPIVKKLCSTVCR